jgi:hypothetical protein
MASGLQRWVILATLTSLVLAIPAAAVPESEAGQLWMAQNGRPGVLAAGHAPAEVAPGAQWEGYLILEDTVTFEKVLFQICLVGKTCFAPPTPAHQADNRTWRFNTTAYRAPGTNALIDWEAGWHVGVRYVIEDRLANGTLRTTVFPHSDDLTAAGAEAHYLTFYIPDAPKRGAPGLPLLAILAALLLAAVRRR